MLAFKIDDFVSVLNEPVYGYVVSSDTKKTTIRDTDGFIRHYQTKLLVAAKPLDNYKLGDEIGFKEPRPEPKKKSLPSIRNSSKTNSITNYEIDLHYDALVDQINPKENYEILQKQLSACRAFLKKAITQHWPRVILIHGKGEGVLKSEIYLYLNRLSKEQGISLTFREAVGDRYGSGGATEVIFHS